ncbi:hypothetical protein Dimus_005932 [Dionaea muscipula]
MYVAACKEFYPNLTVSMFKEKEVARSKVRGVQIELDSMILASILGVPGNNDICEYIKDVWEESKYCKPLEITKKSANHDMITAARRAVNEKAEVQGESGSAEKFYDAKDEVQGSADVIEEVPEKQTTTTGVDASGPVDSIPDSVFLSLQAEFEHARADRIQAELDRVQAENGRLLAQLQQAKSQHKP